MEKTEWGNRNEINFIKEVKEADVTTILEVNIGSNYRMVAFTF